jgi:hypothetical protein
MLILLVRRLPQPCQGDRVGVDVTRGAVARRCALPAAAPRRQPPQLGREPVLALAEGYPFPPLLRQGYAFAPGRTVGQQ